MIASDPMRPPLEIARVFNNNLVLALDEAGRELILTGRGLGFQARPGQAVDQSRVVRVFIPTDGRDPDHLAQLLSGIPSGAHPVGWGRAGRGRAGQTGS